MIRATFELEPHGSAEALAIEESTGMRTGPEFVRGSVVSERDGVAVLEFPDGNWGRNLPLLLSALVAGEGVETRAFTRCRLIDLELPGGFLPGPAFGALGHRGVGLILKPSLGLSPADCARIAEAAGEAGADLVKDDELLGDPEWCPLEARVAAVASVLHPSVVYCPNITGATETLVERARRVVDLGAGGVMVNAFAQGLDAVRALRDADLGVPVLAHRVGSGPWARNDRFGVSSAVLARLTRLAGADYVLVGAYGGKLFDTDADVDAQVAAVRSPSGRARPATAVLGGGVSPANARAQVDRAGGSGLLALLGSAAYTWPGGDVAAAVRATVEAVRG
ncbi:MAG TPA: RuBisCO large subunit C-terminal-like domain-containing protein [Acidimicrobiales bacterium]|nr:RuBisCO large subunit C-terminal-like domain-containing protein [Acidimicrobiales bacterium]